MASWSDCTWLSLVHHSRGPWFEPRACQKQKYCLFSSVRTPDIIQQQNQLPGCFRGLYSSTIFFLCLDPPEKKDSRYEGGEKGYGYMPPKGTQLSAFSLLLHKPWTRPSFLWSLRRPCQQVFIMQPFLGQWHSQVPENLGLRGSGDSSGEGVHMHTAPRGRVTQYLNYRYSVVLCRSC